MCAIYAPNVSAAGGGQNKKDAVRKRDVFFDKLLEDFLVLKNSWPHAQILILGDLNGRLGPITGDRDVHGKFITSGNSNQIVALKEALDLTILNSTHAYGIPTFRKTAGKSSSIIDLVLTQNRHQDAITNFKVNKVHTRHAHAHNTVTVFNLHTQTKPGSSPVSKPHHEKLTDSNSPAFFDTVKKLLAPPPKSSIRNWDSHQTEIGLKSLVTSINKAKSTLLEKATIPHKKSRKPQKTPAIISIENKLRGIQAKIDHTRPQEKVRLDSLRKAFFLAKHKLDTIKAAVKKSDWLKAISQIEKMEIQKNEKNVVDH